MIIYFKNKILINLSVIILALFIVSFQDIDNIKEYRKISKPEELGLKIEMTRFCDKSIYESNFNLLLDHVINYGKRFIGLPYRYKGFTSRGFDCSGYISFIFSRFDIKLPRSSADQANVGKKVNLIDAKKGDLIFFKGVNSKNNRVGHVAIIIGRDETGVIIMHSSFHGILIEKLSESPYYLKRYVTCRRIEI